MLFHPAHCNFCEKDFYIPSVGPREYYPAGYVPGQGDVDCSNCLLCQSCFCSRCTAFFSLHGYVPSRISLDTFYGRGWLDICPRCVVRRRDVHRGFLSFLMASNDRLGAESPARVLPPELFHYIYHEFIVQRQPRVSNPIRRLLGA
eukprot:TRINITY_DN13870_c0_g1_i1.p1 TRINITY_DN13870_c0_g1~~TRINITY_DN13870_c0_g1_i1.p1  ORF type:complete len:146 (+),score=11.07 TRINITY_DN13870_c0_g1_i1:351-788(+)